MGVLMLLINNLNMKVSERGRQGRQTQDANKQTPKTLV